MSAIKMSENHNLTVLYASQTGTAQEIAENAWRTSKTLHFTGRVQSMDEYPLDDLINRPEPNYVLFVCSTTGQGDEPDNMKRFWRFLLRKNLPNDLFKRLHFAILGLGDSTYVKFNYTSRRLFTRLKQLGAVAICDLALADEQHEFGLDSVCVPFLTTFFERLLERTPIPNGLTPLTNQLILRHDVTVVNDGAVDVDIWSDGDSVRVLANERVTSHGHFQDVRLIRFTSLNVEYNPGDCLHVRPRNSHESVDEFFSILRDNEIDLTRETCVIIQPRSTQIDIHPTLNGRTLRLEQLARDYWDLNAPPRRYVFEIFARTTTSDLERDKCLEFQTPNGLDDYYAYCTRPKRTVLECLRDFPHVARNLTLNVLFEIFTPIRARAYSLCSSYHAHMHELHILVALVRYRTRLVKERVGLASTWLGGLTINDEIRVTIKRGSLNFNGDVATIMIGPGTGVAPFRSFIAERIDSGRGLVLFFGCRNRANDFYFQNEFEKFVRDDRLTLICAFSRDQDHKVYVQDKIREHAQLVWNVIHNENGRIFLAGNAKQMPDACRQALIDVFSDRTDDGEGYFNRLVQSGRYQTETWA